MHQNSGSVVMVLAALIGLVSPAVLVAGDGDRDGVRDDGLRFPVPVKGRFGYVDGHGRLVIECHFETASRFRDGFAVCGIGGGASVVIDSSGRIVLMEQGDVAHVRRGLFAVTAKAHTRFVGLNEQFTCDIEVAGVLGRFENGRLAVKSEERWGFIDEIGRVAIAPVYDAVLPFSEGLAAVRKGGQWGYIDTSGQVVVEPKFIAAGDFSEGFSPVRTARGTVFIDRRGAEVFSTAFGNASPFRGGFARVELQPNGGSNHPVQGYIDLRGRLVIDAVFFRASSFLEGLAATESQAGTQGYINQKGRLTVPISGATFMGDFCDGLAWVVSADRVGYVDRKGAWIWSTATDDAVDSRRPSTSPATAD